MSRVSVTWRDTESVYHEASQACEATSLTPIEPTRMMKIQFLLPLVSLLIVNSSLAALIASYVNGTSVGFPSGNNGTSSSIASVTSLSVVGLNGRVTNTESNGGYGSATSSTTLPGAPANNWLYAGADKTVAIGTPDSADDYIGLTIVFAEPATLASLSFNSVNGSSNTTNGGLDTAYTVFASINGGAFSQVGSTQNSTPWSGSTGSYPNTLQLGFESALSFNLTSLGAFVASDTVQLRLNLQDSSNLIQKNNFLKDIQLTTVPEPSAPFLISVTALFLGFHRKRRLG